MIRPRLFFFLNHTLSPKNCQNEAFEKNEMLLASLIELIHLASLIHDDVIDKDLTRRGLPTINCVAGNKIAVAMGDFILSKSLEVAFVGIDFTASLHRLVVLEVVKAISDLACGELLQDDASTFELQYEKLASIARLKTGALFRLPCSLSIIMSGCTDTNAMECAAKMGENIGIAFQILDDNADFFIPSKNNDFPNSRNYMYNMAFSLVKADMLSKKGHGELGAVNIMRTESAQRIVKSEVRRLLEVVVKIGMQLPNNVDLEPFLKTVFDME
jgi:geranylgeranyl pyrophosphate synthase